MKREEIREVQRIVNEKIRQNLRVYDEELSYKQAIEEGAIALFDEKYGDTVRVLKIGEPAISAELCGGTHVGSTGEIGFFHIIGESGCGIVKGFHFGNIIGNSHCSTVLRYWGNTAFGFVS